LAGRENSVEILTEETWFGWRVGEAETQVDLGASLLSIN
jgi:hypothetical protein